MTTQDPVHRAGREAELRAEPVRTPPMLTSSFDHDRFDPGCGPGRHPMRLRRPIEQAGIAFGVEAGDPPMRALTRHAHRPGDVRYRHPLLSDSTDQKTATMHRQPGVTVRHEDLRML